MTEQAQSAATVSSDQALGWYRQMVHIRKFEEKVVELSGRGLVSGSTHPCIAQEAVSVGCISALSAEDLVLATYRGHGAFLARGGDPKAAMAEILCRETGCCKGKGGSMHLCDPDIGFLGTNAIVAAHIPIASGVALANQLKKTRSGHPLPFRRRGLLRRCLLRDLEHGRPLEDSGGAGLRE